MNNSETCNKTIIEKWRELGFYYKTDDKLRQWILTGSRDGLLNFHAILTDYVSDPQNEKISSHEHYGPHMYLKIMTWESPGINKHSIHGSIHDINRLAATFILKLKDTPVGSHFVIGRDYASGCDYSIQVNVREDGFDPCSLDT